MRFGYGLLTKHHGLVGSNQHVVPFHCNAARNNGYRPGGNDSLGEKNCGFQQTTTRTAYRREETKMELYSYGRLDRAFFPRLENVGKQIPERQRSVLNRREKQHGISFFSGQSFGRRC